jgi:hypothetical protein
MNRSGLNSKVCLEVCQFIKNKAMTGMEGMGFVSLAAGQEYIYFIPSFIVLFS